MEIEKFKEFVRLSEKKRELSYELDRVKEKIAEMEPGILDAMANSGMDRMTLDGMTLYIHSQLWAGVADGYTKAEAVQSLKANGLGDFVQETFSTQTLSAHFRELSRDDAPVTPPPGIQITEKYSVRSRRS